MSDDAILKRWQKWMENIQAQTAELLLYRETWNKLRDIVKNNKNLPPYFYLFDDFMAHQYVMSQTVGIRRIATDTTKGVISLRKLLIEIRGHPSVIKRDLFLVHVTSGNPTDTGFYKFADKQGKLDVSLIDNDIKAHIPQFAFAFFAKSLVERIDNIELLNNSTV